MKSIKDIYLELTTKVLEEIKEPHGMSELVIRRENNNYYLAMFIFFYDTFLLEQGRAKRPEAWLVVDIQDGSIIEYHKCREKDFSNAEFDKTYKMSTDGMVTYNFNIRSAKILEDIRDDIIDNNEFNKEKYVKYLNLILKKVPEEYKRFYSELSNF